MSGHFTFLFKTLLSLHLTLILVLSINFASHSFVFVIFLEFDDWNKIEGYFYIHFLS